MSTVKRKRYFGRRDNVSKNLFFEDFMASVSKEKERNLKVKPVGFMSRDEIEKKFKFSVNDFEAIKQVAIISTNRGQKGLYFPMDAVREHNDTKLLSNVPSDWIDEQSIIRSHRKKDLPPGFPEDFRQYGRYGKQVDRAGKSTYFYSKAFLSEHLNLKVLDPDEPFIKANSVPFSVDFAPVMCLKVTKPPTLVALGFSGDLAKKIIQALRQGCPSESEKTFRSLVVAIASTPKKSSSTSSSVPSINFSPILEHRYSPQSISDITPTDGNPSPNEVKNMSILLNKNWSPSWMSLTGHSPTPSSPAQSPGSPAQSPGSPAQSPGSPAQSPPAPQSLPTTKPRPTTGSHRSSHSLATSQYPSTSQSHVTSGFPPDSMLEAVPVDRNYLKNTPPPGPGFGSVVNRIKNYKIPYKPMFN